MQQTMSSFIKPARDMHKPTFVHVTRRAVCCRGHKLPVQHVIHVVPPIYDDYSPEEAEELFANAHRCQEGHGMQSVL